MGGWIVPQLTQIGDWFPSLHFQQITAILILLQKKPPYIDGYFYQISSQMSSQISLSKT
jgi:hypothetical protein